MRPLKQPDAALAARILGKVGYEHRFVACRFRPRSGAIPARLYSFGEVCRLFRDKYPRADLGKLEQWLRNAMGDDELADRVVEAVREEACDRDRTVRVGELLAARLEQCRQTVPA